MYAPFLNKFPSTACGCQLGMHAPARDGRLLRRPTMLLTFMMLLYIATAQSYRLVLPKQLDLVVQAAIKVKEVLPASGYTVLEFEDTNAAELYLQKLKATTPGIKAYEDLVLEAAWQPNDPQLAAQSYLEQIRAHAAWDLHRGNSETLVCLPDTGVDVNHKDLRVHATLRRNAMTGGKRVRDQVGHGTAVAGVLAAVAGNELGIAGVAKATIVPCKFLGSRGRGWSSHAAECLDWCRQNGVNFAVASWATVTANKPEALEAAIIRFTQAGGLIVAATGNRNLNLEQTPSYPAAFRIDGLLAVTGLDSSGTQLWPSSNYGSGLVSLAAPAERILTTAPRQKYQQLSGTSMAAPMALGVALMMHAASAGTLTSKQIIEVMLSTAVKMSSLSTQLSLAGGALDAAAAVSRAFQRDKLMDRRFTCRLFFMPEVGTEDGYVEFYMRWESKQYPQGCQGSKNMGNVIKDGQPVDFNDRTARLNVTCTCGRINCPSVAVNTMLYLYKEIDYGGDALLAGARQQTGWQCSARLCTLLLNSLPSTWNRALSSWQLCPSGTTPWES